jgi:hypothetical protein
VLAKVQRCVSPMMLSLLSVYLVVECYLACLLAGIAGSCAEVWPVAAAITSIHCWLLSSVSASCAEVSKAVLTATALTMAAAVLTNCVPLLLGPSLVCSWCRSG